MKYQITSDNIQISQSMKELATQKFEKVDKFLSYIDEGSKHVRIVMSSAAEEGKFIVKILLNANGKEYFTDETEYGLDLAMSKAVDEIIKMIKKDKKY